MKPVVWILPLLLLLGGVATFFLLNLPMHLRLAILGSDIVGALVVGFVLWRRQS